MVGVSSHFIATFALHISVSVCHCLLLNVSLPSLDAEAHHSLGKGAGTVLTIFKTPGGNK